MEQLPYKIIHDSILCEEDIVLIDTHQERQYPLSILNLIDKSWDEVNSNKDIFIFNGKVSCLDSWEITDNKLIVNYCESDYKSYFGTNIKNLTEINNNNLLANTLAVCTVVVTSDNKIIIGKRGTHLAEGTALWHVPGGTLEYYPERANHPFEVMKRELHEELNLTTISSMHYLGFGINLVFNKPEFLLYTKTNLTSTEIKTNMINATDYNEHSEIRFIDVSDITSFIDTHNFTEIGRAVVTLYLKYKEKLNDK